MAGVTLKRGVRALHGPVVATAARMCHVDPVGVGHFRNDDARDAYLATYDRALAAWPAAPTTSHVETAVGTTCVHSLGPRSGSPIVLLHAIAVASPMWFRAVGALSERHPVYALDTITDAGRSAQREAIDDAAGMAGWLEDVLAELELDRVHLVGLSYGGWLALNQAQHAPDRLTSVTVIDPPGAIGSAQVKPMLGMVPDALRAKFGKSDVALRRLIARLNNGTPPPEPVLELAMSGLRAYKSRAPRPKRISDDDLRSISTPTFLMLCDASPVNHARRAEQRATECMPQVTVTVVEGGHMLPVEHSADFTSRVLEFVDAEQ
jgi:pimeloyl-ACP methyl ester carboxylesterase